MVQLTNQIIKDNTFSDTFNLPVASHEIESTDGQLGKPEGHYKSMFKDSGLSHFGSNSWQKDQDQRDPNHSMNIVPKMAIRINSSDNKKEGNGLQSPCRSRKREKKCQQTGDDLKPNKKVENGVYGL